MARCRIYVLTYKRNHLLSRAIQSLLDQSFPDWVCEIHNDSPDDHFPESYIRSLNDPRFIVKNHDLNIGAVASFNLTFAVCEEQYASILEDDNWWQPDFLLEMVYLMDNNPAVNIAWSNMNLWEEMPGNEWKNTGKTIWPQNKGVYAFKWPENKQAMSALHSNGAMMFRSKTACNYVIPEKVFFNAIELVRERSFEHPILLNNKPLANFAITINTNRTNDPYIWIATQAMLLASFVQASYDPQKTFIDSLDYYRTQEPNPLANFFLANFLIIKNRSLYKYFKINDWFAITKWLVKHGYRLNYIKNYLKTQNETYSFLLKKTRLRYQESNKGQA